MNTTQSRRPAGSPSGGQFATTSRPESNLDLPDSAADDPVERHLGVRECFETAEDDACALTELGYFSVVETRNLVDTRPRDVRAAGVKPGAPVAQEFEVVSFDNRSDFEEYLTANPGIQCSRDGFSATGRAGFEPEIFTDAEMQGASDSQVETALWSSCTEDGRPLDSDHDADDLDPELREQLDTELRDFVDANLPTIARIRAKHPEFTASQLAHDFWLTRNRHGAGFWDRGYGEDGDKLTEAAHVYGGVDLYVGDDGVIHA